MKEKLKGKKLKDKLGDILKSSEFIIFNYGRPKARLKKIHHENKAR